MNRMFLWRFWLVSAESVEGAVIRIGFALLVVCGATMVAAAGGPPARAPSLEAKELVYDAGKVTRGVKLAHTFLLKNVGPIELSVDAKPG